ncbi:hypothetical protein [Paenibacillus sp. CGMCC 1.18879]|uniref:hypothetical protein n=1 Tax=Paenibacillus sp. CGMCC 1.18879 TaxID=2834466 RepID=UPI001CA8B2CE|nr:hypothetical protein [Paenibacillus sp. CGMCC 1.18879]MBY9077380.1 hypothetical protein [Paenibacillus sp. CGMCC 1.18879]
METWLDFYGGWTEPRKLFDYNVLHRDQLLENDIVPLTQQYINKGFYIYTYIDKSLILKTSKELSMSEHFVHDILIYGQNYKTKSFSVIGFDDRYSFTAFDIPFDLFKTAFLSGADFSKDSANGVSYATAFRIKEEFKNTQYPFHLQTFLHNLYEYIHSINSSKSNDSNDPDYDMYKLPGNVYGMSIYTNVLEYLDQLSNENLNLDYRLFHTLYEHKMSIYERVQYVSELYKLSEDVKLQKLLLACEEICKDFKKIRMLAIKHIMSSDKSLLNRMKSLVEANVKKEEETLKELYAIFTSISYSKNEQIHIQ